MYDVTPNRRRTSRGRSENVLRITQIRRQRGLSQAAVCRMTGISAATLSALESGKVHPWPGWKRRLSRALGVPADELFEQAGEDAHAHVG